MDAAGTKRHKQLVWQTGIVWLQKTNDVTGKVRLRAVQRGRERRLLNYFGYTSASIPLSGDI
jgi:hypothetical protein